MVRHAPDLAKRLQIRKGVNVRRLKWEIKRFQATRSGHRHHGLARNKKAGRKNHGAEIDARREASFADIDFGQHRRRACKPRKLSAPLPNKKAGRNNHGHITVRHQGGGMKSSCHRIIDIKCNAVVSAVPIK